MKVRNEDVWQASRAEMLAHGDAGVEMLQFVTEWAETAEHVMDKESEFAQDDGSWSGTDPADALRKALVAVEAMGKWGLVNVSAISQGIILLLANWIHGEQIMGGLTIFEQRMVTDMISLKQMELAQAAVVNGSGSVG
jgi:hypothetical protein